MSQVRQPTLFDDQRLTLREAIAETAENLNYYAQFYKHWAIAYSGGKDSSAAVSCVIDLIESGVVPRPESLTVIWADTRQELPPLSHAATQMLQEVDRRGFRSMTAVAAMDKRFWVNIAGRGVIPPNNGRARWCTRQIKGEPMNLALQGLIDSLPNGERLLMITGVRQGESAARDRRIAISCSKDSGECGQGYFQAEAESRKLDTLAPIVHWRVCHVWDYLMFDAAANGFPTDLVADAYGMNQRDGEESLEMRTGCIGCPLVSSEDTALARLIKNPDWAYLSPLKEIRSIHDWLRLHRNRLRKDGTERNKNGKPSKNPGRVGCLKLEARLEALDRVLGIQRQVNEAAVRLDRPTIDIINTEEEARIRELIALRTFPQKWTGDELSGDTEIPEVYADGSVQTDLWGLIAGGTT